MEQVICVDDQNPGNGVWVGPTPKRGETYSVVGRYACNGLEGVYIYELKTNAKHRDGTEVGYLASRFVPIKDENIEVFREIARKVPKRKTEHA